MNVKILAGAVLAFCFTVAAFLAVTHRPGSGPAAPAGSAGPTAPPASWPDYRGDGFGFATPATPNGALIAQGHQLVTRTFAFIGPEVADPTKRYAGNNLACQNCHLDGGTNRTAMPLVGIVRTYPKLSARSGKTITLIERIDECMTRSMNGRALPENSREMQAFLAYLRFIGEPQAETATTAPAAALPPDAARGVAAFEKNCAVCHGMDGLGTRWGTPSDGRGYRFPPLWGPDSFNDGAGMDRFDRSVRFIQSNMPRGIDPVHPVLDLQAAWDIAALIQSRPRPHYQPR
jgi:thiosulfate dehydrogenase